MPRNNLSELLFLSETRKSYASLMASDKSCLGKCWGEVRNANWNVNKLGFHIPEMTQQPESGIHNCCRPVMIIMMLYESIPNTPSFMIAKCHSVSTEYNLESWLPRFLLDRSPYFSTPCTSWFEKIISWLLPFVFCWCLRLICICSPRFILLERRRGPESSLQTTGNCINYTLPDLRTMDPFLRSSNPGEMIYVNECRKLGSGRVIWLPELGFVIFKAAGFVVLIGKNHQETIISFIPRIGWPMEMEI